MRRVIWITHQHVHLYRAIILPTNRSHLGKVLTEHHLNTLLAYAGRLQISRFVCRQRSCPAIPPFLPKEGRQSSQRSDRDSYRRNLKRQKTWQKGNDKRWLQIYANAPTAHHFHRKRMTAIVLLARGLT